MSITSGGMGRSVGQAFADHGFGGGFDRNPNVVPAGFSVARPGLVHQMVNNAFQNRTWANRVVPNVPQTIPRTVDNVYRPHYMEPPQIDRNMPDRPFPNQWRDPLEQPGGRMTSPMQRYNIQEMQRTQGATYRGSSESGNQRDGSGGGARTSPPTINPQYRLPTFRNAAGQVVPAAQVATNAINRLFGNQALTRNQNLVVGKALRHMTPDQRRTFGVSLALAMAPGQNVNVVMQTQLAKPFGTALRVARAHRRQVQAAKNR